MAYRCLNCRAWNDYWIPACPVCRVGAIMPLHVYDEAMAQEQATRAPVRRVETLADAPDVLEVRISTGIDGLDRVLGGGMVSPAVILFAGPPGCGKSSILLPMIASMAERSNLYVSTEEKAPSLRRRAIRFGLKDKLGRIPTLCSQEFGEIYRYIHHVDPRVVILDSLNDIKDALHDANNDPMADLKRNVSAIWEDAHTNNRIVFLVSHVNKAEDISGLKYIQHKVETVMMISKKGAHRTLRCPEKNRNGSTEDTATFLMTKSGLHEVADEDDDGERPVADASRVIAAMSGASDEIPLNPRQRRRG